MEENTAKTAADESAAHTGCFVCNTALPLLEHCWSEATRDHFRNSRIEFLKGIRSVIDDRIEHLSKHKPSAGTHVVVE
jgi:hypothetical protein